MKKSEILKAIDDARKSNAEYYWYDVKLIDAIVSHKPTKKRWKYRKGWPLPESKKAAIRRILEAAAPQETRA